MPTDASSRAVDRVTRTATESATRRRKFLVVDQDQGGQQRIAAENAITQVFADRSTR
jgi:hypothetical protein